MATERSKTEQRRRARVGELDHRPRRLLKTFQDADLVRRMDAVILASDGAYADRSEFAAEALRDRIEAEEERLQAEAAREPTAITIAGDDTGLEGGETELTIFGDWLGEDVPTLPAATGPATNFGLHNRDYPTLWVADNLGRMTARAESAVTWRDFLADLMPRAWEVGRLLARRDLDRPPGAKLAAGFPTNLKKREGAESRFRAHAAGVVSDRGHQGPVFVFGLIGLEGDGEEALAALSPDGVALLERLTAAGIANGPPFGEEAWSAFRTHLEAHAAAELAAAELEIWLKVLAVVADEPDRTSLIEACDWWEGSTADTNAMSYIARGREWGLVEQTLIDGRYRLTQRGQQEAGRRATTSERTR